MSNVLGTFSFLETPDVNGELLLTATNPVLSGTGSLTLPSGTTAQRPGFPVVGMTRYNSTINKLEYYNGSAWIPNGQILQSVTGVIARSTSNAVLPYDATIPLNTEGLQLWTQSFTPILSNSFIIIQSSSFFAVNSAADTYVSGAIFSGTTCILAQLLGFTTNSGNGNAFSMIGSEVSGSTTTRTYSCRIGPNSAVSVFYGQGVTQTFGGVVDTGRYVITEIAP